MLRTDDVHSSSTALAHGANGALALWSQGRRAEALELTRTFSEAAELVCGQDDPSSKRNCLAARAAFQQQLAWADDARAPALLEEVLRRQTEVLAQEPDSSTLLHDAMWTAFEQGDFVASSRFAAQLRERHPSESLGLGVLAAVLSGTPPPQDEVDSAPADAAGALAHALQAAADGQFAQAAKTLRGVERSTLWYQVSWTPHPKPALVLPPAAQPAFARFLVDFTHAYGEADMKALSASVDALADAFDALASK